MSNTFIERLRVLSSGLAYLLPGLALFAVAAFVEHPLILAALLLADALVFIAVCQAMDLEIESDLAHGIRRALAYLVLLTIYTGCVALVTSYPLGLLLRDQSLEAALLLSTALFVVLLAPWRLWPAFGLAVVSDEAWLDNGRSSGMFAALKRSLGIARHLTVVNDLFFGSGLIVSICLLLLAEGALALAGLGMTLPYEVRIVTLVVYALGVVPITHRIMARRSLRALRVERRRQRDEHTKNFEPVAPDLGAAISPPTRVDAVVGKDQLEGTLLSAVRACQTDVALSALAQGADPNCVPEAGERDQRSALVLACVSPDLRLLRGLIAKGADVNRVHAGLPPLIAATRDSHQGRPDTVMTLLTNGADPCCTDGSGNTPLHYAALAAQPIVAALLCDAAAPIDAINNDGQTPLGIAGAAGNRDLVRFLLDRGADPELDHAQPVLHAAAAVSDDDPAVTKLLLKQKAQVDVRDTLGRTALMTAALHGNADIAATLLKAGAQVDLADTRGVTALMEAARSGAADVIEVLAAHRPDAELADRLGRTALMLASQSAQADETLVRRLLGLGASRQTISMDGRRAVDFAAAAGRWNIVSMLDPDYILPASVDDSSGVDLAEEEESPQHLLDALRFGHWNVVEKFGPVLRDWPMSQRSQLFLDLSEHEDAAPRAWLLNHGLDANAQSVDGASLSSILLKRLPVGMHALRELIAAGAQMGGIGTLEPVFAAIERNSAPRAELETLAHDLIERGADPFAIDANSATFLARSVAFGSTRLVDALLQRGIDVNARDRQGRTALFAALALPTETAVTLTRSLIASGADPELAAANGETPLGLSLARPLSGLHRWLNWSQWKLPKRALRAADLPAAANAGDFDAVDKLLELGFPVEAVDVQGASALLRAAGAGHHDLVVHLLKRGARADCSALSGATALSAAVSARRDSVVEAMLVHGVDVDQRLPSGGTALMIAAALGYPEIVARLLARGADANAQDERGIRALHAAAQYAFGSRDTARARRPLELLIEKGAQLDAADAKGRTPLLLLLGARAEPGSSADQQHLQSLLSLFLVGRADLNVQDQRGVSPLHACAMHGLLLPARALLAARANPESHDMHGRTPREVANLLGYIDVAAELTARGRGAMPTPGQPALR